MNKRLIKRLNKYYSDIYGIERVSVKFDFNREIIQVYISPSIPVTFIDISFCLTSDGADFTA